MTLMNLGTNVVSAKYKNTCAVFESIQSDFNRWNDSNTGYNSKGKQNGIG